MDVFSSGCVLAELFLEGAALFTLSQLFKYRTGDLDVNIYLAAIEEEPIRVSCIAQRVLLVVEVSIRSSLKDLIKRMVALEPADRPLFDTILHTSRGTIFPESFYSPLHDFVSSVTDLSVSSPFTSVPSAGSATPTSSMPSAGDDKQPYTNGTPDDASILPTDSDRRIMRVWAEYDVIEPVISMTDLAATVKIDFANNYSSSKPLQVCNLKNQYLSAFDVTGLYRH